MRLQVNDYGFDSKLPENEQRSRIKNSAKMFSILSDSMYKDKILAVIRELSCNARDAHHDAQKLHVPFKLKLPSTLDPTFMIEDEGIGIDPSRMCDVYLTYGESTKTEDDNAIGALGLGSKSPFAYTKSSFIVRTRWYTPPSIDPVLPISEFTFFVFIGSDGCPAISLVGIEQSDRAFGGLTVEFATKPEDEDLFSHGADKFYRYWKEVLPVFVDRDVNEILVTKPEKIIDEGSWYLERRDVHADFKGAYAIMGNVPYPILADSITNLPENLKIIAKNSFIIEFPLGHLAFAPSREDLSYDEFTCKNLIKRLEEVRVDLANTFKRTVFKKGQTQVEFRHNFYTALTGLAKTIRPETVKIGFFSTMEEWFCEHIFGKKLKERVNYQGYSFLLDDLVNRKAEIEIMGIQPFNVIEANVRGRNARLYLSPCTIVNATNSTKILREALYPGEFGGRSEYSAGTCFDFPWQSSIFKTKKSSTAPLGKVSYTPLQRAILLGSFTFTSTTNLSLHGNKITFVINDEGSTGEYKFKCFVEKADDPHAYFFIRHNPKEITIENLCTEISKFIKNGIDGATVTFLSNLEDHRPTIDKVKLDSGTIKISQTKFTHHPSLSVNNVSVYMGHKSKCTMVKVPQYTRHETSLVKIDDLKNSVHPWLYVIKNRSRKEIFDQVKYGLERSILLSTSYSREGFNLAVHAGLFDDVHREQIISPGKDLYEYPVLVLNEGQVKWLATKGVKLVGIRDHLENRLKAELQRKNFIEEIADESVMENLDLIKEIYHALPTDLKNLLTVDGDGIDQGFDQSFLSEMLLKYEEHLKLKGTKTDSYLLMTLYQQFVDRSAEPNIERSLLINQKLNESYPILKLISYQEASRDDFLELINYIKFSEQRVEEVRGENDTHQHLACR